MHHTVPINTHQAQHVTDNDKCEFVFLSLTFASVLALVRSVPGHCDQRILMIILVRGLRWRVCTRVSSCFLFAVRARILVGTCSSGRYAFVFVCVCLCHCVRVYVSVSPSVWSLALVQVCLLRFRAGCLCLRLCVLLSFFFSFVFALVRSASGRCDERLVILCVQYLCAFFSFSFAFGVLRMCVRRPHPCDRLCARLAVVCQCACDRPTCDFVKLTVQRRCGRDRHLVCEVSYCRM